MRFAAGLEKGAVSAYLSAVRPLGDRGLATTAASILADEDALSDPATGARREPGAPAVRRVKPARDAAPATARSSPGRREIILNRGRGVQRSSYPPPAAGTLTR